MKLIECPRDAMQGIHDFIPTEQKAEYINTLLQVGFDALDFGSFVSRKAIPQMADTEQLLWMLDLEKTKTKLLAIVANLRGALAASQYSQIQYLGYPFSISETFQIRNTNSTIEESLERVCDIQDICIAQNKELVIYISMGFGNPYGDEWNVNIVQDWVGRLSQLGIKIFQLSDTVGVANPENISYLYKELIPAYPDLEIGSHFHTTQETWREKIEAAFDNGCKRFDGTIRGYGGCPMAQNDLVGNMPSENLIAFAQEKNISLELDMAKYAAAVRLSNTIMP